MENQLRNGRVRITLHDDDGAVYPGCAAAPVLEVITGNLVSDFEDGMVAGSGIVTLPRVISNRIGPNTFDNHQIGVNFSDDAWVNDATGNYYPGMLTPVSDGGTGNLF